MEASVESSPLEKIIAAVGDFRTEDRHAAMTNVDVLNRLAMNDRQRHTMDRLDAQVDALQRKAHGDCYQPPAADRDHEHRINSPTITIGAEAAAQLGGLAGAAPPQHLPPPQHSPPPNSGWLKAALLAAISSAATAGVVSYMTDDDTDTRNTYDIKAVPFDPGTQ